MPETDTLVHKLFAARSYASSKALEEQANVSEGERPWGIYGTGLWETEYIFREVTQESEFFRRWVADRNKTGPVYALEAFADGQLLREIPELAGGVAVTLYDHRDRDQKDDDASRGLVLIAGDIMTGNIWRKIKDQLQNRSISGFDLVVCSPIMGWQVLGANADAPEEFQWLIVNKLYQLLNPTGVLLVDFESAGIREETLIKWLPKLQIHNLNVVHNADYMRLRVGRNNQNPNHLPRF